MRPGSRLFATLTLASLFALQVQAQHFGFAVVASEMRALPGRSAASAREIRTLIGSSVEQGKGGSATVQYARATMDEVVHEVHEILRTVSEMAQAGFMQAEGVAEVNGALAVMDHGRQRIAAMVEAAAAATKSPKRQADELMRSLAVLRVDAVQPRPDRARFSPWRRPPQDRSAAARHPD